MAIRNDGDLQQIHETAVFLESIKNNAGKLFNELLEVEDHHLEQVQIGLLNQPGPVNRLRTFIATELLAGKVVDASILESKKMEIQNQEGRDVFKVYSNPFSILFPFFIDKNQRNEKRLFLDFYSKIVRALGLKENVNVDNRIVTFEGARNQGTDRIWMAIYNATHPNQRTAKQLFLEINAGGVNVSFYDRPNESHTKSLFIDVEKFDIYNVIDFFQEFRDELLNDEFTPTFVDDAKTDETLKRDIYKLSHGSGVIPDESYLDMLDKKVVVVHEVTEAMGKMTETQYAQFASAKKGDLFYLCRSNDRVVLLGEFIGDVEENEIESLESGWKQRKYKIIREAIDNTGYTGKETRWWLSNFNSTFVRIKESEYSLADTEIFIPFFDDRLEDLLKEHIEEGKPKESVEANDKIPFHLDNVESVDHLNRRPVAESLARMINNDIFDKNPKHAFMIHLQGEWGAGKSTFLNLIRQNLDTEKRKWIVINYNAWQNQHLSPPWWTFIDQIYHEAKVDRQITEVGGEIVIGDQKLGRCKRWKLWFNENFRRIIWYKARGLALNVVFLLLLLGLLFFGDQLIDLFIDNSQGTEPDKLADRWKLVTTIISVIGTLYALSRLFASSIFIRSSREAESFVKQSSDPNRAIKRHFEKLIDDINRKGFEVAIFIDDVDRCNKEYLIELLEGIQTLFKDKRVLYIVAGDKNWITTCFEKNYIDFKETIPDQGQNLGDLFLEKAFQLSVRMPNISEDTKRDYWHHLIGKKLQKLETEIPKQAKEEMKEQLRGLNLAGQALGKAARDLWENEEYSKEDLASLAMEVAEENKEEITHLLANHHDLIEPNPRSIKRLANEYTMYRSVLMAEFKEVDENYLFRWLIISNNHPGFAKIAIENLEAFDDLKKLNQILKEYDSEKLTELVMDSADLHGGKLTAEVVEQIVGTK